MLVSFNGHFIEAHFYHLMMSFVDIAQTQVVRKGQAATSAPSFGHAASATATAVPVPAVRVPAAYGQGALPTVPHQAPRAIEVEP